MTKARKVSYYVGLGDPPKDAEEHVLHVVRKWFTKGATVNFGWGVWDGSLEYQATITQVREVLPDWWVMDRAENLAKEFGEECVLVVAEDIETELVYK